jgi:hypothetical protein
LNALEIPIDNIGTIIKTLDLNSHIEFEVVHFRASKIRISPKGSALVNGLGYQKGYGVADIKIHHVIITEHDLEELKERLELDNLKLNVQLLKMQVADYDKMKQRTIRSELIAVFAAILTMIGLVLQWLYSKPD